jgi:hypothetical protein
MNRAALVFALALALGVSSTGCVAETAATEEEATSQHEALAAATDTKIKNAIVKTTTGLLFTSESDHDFEWVRSSTVANAWFLHKSFSSVTDGDAMADKPLSKLKSETIDFESFASRFVPVPGEDADNFAYHQRMTKVFAALRANLQHPVVIRFGRASSSGLVGAISVYIVGTLPSGKVGGLFTVAVETLSGSPEPEAAVDGDLAGRERSRGAVADEDRARLVVDAQLQLTRGDVAERDDAHDAAAHADGHVVERRAGGLGGRERRDHAAGGHDDGDRRAGRRARALGLEDADR